MIGFVIFCSVISLICILLTVVLILPLPFSFRSVIAKYIYFLNYIYVIPRIILIVFVIIEAMALRKTYGNSHGTDIESVYYHQRNIFLSILTFILVHVLHLLSATLNKLLNEHKLLQEQLTVRKNAYLRVQKDHID